MGVLFSQLLTLKHAFYNKHHSSTMPWRYLGATRATTNKAQSHSFPRAKPMACVCQVLEEKQFLNILRHTEI